MPGLPVATPTCDTGFPVEAPRLVLEAEDVGRDSMCSVMADISDSLVVWVKAVSGRLLPSSRRGAVPGRRGRIDMANTGSFILYVLVFEWDPILRSLD